jgi:hypothetical protein
MNEVEKTTAQLEPLSLAPTYGESRNVIHALFRFPGRFHPPLVSFLMAQHPEAKLVGDLMAGSGSVAVQAAFNGRDSLCSDIDPLCCLLTRAKSMPVDPNWLLEIMNKVLEKCKPMARPGVRRSRARRSISDIEGSTPFRAPPNVFHWFKPYVVVDLCRFLAALDDIDTTSRRRDSLLAILASVIRRVSRADPETSSGLEVTKVRKDALRAGLRFDLGKEITRKTIQAAKAYHKFSTVEHIGRATVVQEDAKAWFALCAKTGLYPDLLITSPCYMSAIEYWRRHKLEHCWLGLVEPQKLLDLQQKYLGMGHEEANPTALPGYVRRLHSRFSRLGYNREAKALARYFNDSKSWLEQVFYSLKKTNGIGYVVIGENCTKGQSINTPFALRRIAESVGLNAEVFMRYRLKNYHMQYPTNGSRIEHETVLKVTPD